MIIVIPILIGDFIINQKTRLFTKSNHLICLLNTSYNYLICLFILSIKHLICIQHIPTNSYNFWSYLPIIFTLKISDNGSNTFLCNVDKTIKKVLEVWKKFSFKNMSLWETFQYSFENFTEEDFKLASIYQYHKLWDYV